MDKWVKIDKKRILEALVFSFFPTFIVCLYAPYKLYLNNSGEFWFNLRTIWAIPFVTFIVVFAVSTAIGILAKGTFRYAYLGMLFGLGVCLYIQGNFMGLNIGRINGTNIDWSMYRTRMIICMAIWITIIAVAIFVMVRFKDSFCDSILAIAGVLSIIQVAFLITSLVPALSSEKETNSATETFLSSDYIYEVGSNGNIIVFVLDAFDGTYIDKILEDNPEIADELEGFTLYENYTGLYPQTEYSVAAMIGGNVLHNEYPRTQWVEENAKNRIYMDELTDAGYDLSIYTSMQEDVPLRVTEKCDNYAVAHLDFYNTRTCFSLLYRLVACTYAPDILKPYLWMKGDEFKRAAKSDIDSEYFDNSNDVFRDGLRNQRVSVAPNAKKFKFIHIWGVHEPFRIDANGDDIEENWDRNIDAAKGCLHYVREYLNDMKSQGVYDNSAIIITADHGWHGNDGIISNPVFMIKDFGASGSLLKTDAPASHADLGATVARLAGCEDVSAYGMAVQDIKEDAIRDRFYYGYTYPLGTEYQNICLMEYKTGVESNDTELFMPTDIEYTWTGEVISHKKHCKTCIDGVEPGDYAGWKQLIHEHTDDYPEK